VVNHIYDALCKNDVAGNVQDLVVSAGAEKISIRQLNNTLLR
jgi:hypothetical protein